MFLIRIVPNLKVLSENLMLVQGRYYILTILKQFNNRPI